eukprot:721363_1
MPQIPDSCGNCAIGCYYMNCIDVIPIIIGIMSLNQCQAMQKNYYITIFQILKALVGMMGIIMEIKFHICGSDKMRVRGMKMKEELVGEDAIAPFKTLFAAVIWDLFIIPGHVVMRSKSCESNIRYLNRHLAI